MNLRPLTLDDFPVTGRMCLVYGSLSPHPGPMRVDTALLSVDHKTEEMMWLGGRFICKADAGSPAVVAWCELPPAADVEAMLAGAGVANRTA